MSILMGNVTNNCGLAGDPGHWVGDFHRTILMELEMHPQIDIDYLYWVTITIGGIKQAAGIAGTVYGLKSCVDYGIGGNTVDAWTIGGCITGMIATLASVSHALTSRALKAKQKKLIAYSVGNFAAQVSQQNELLAETGLFNLEAYVRDADAGGSRLAVSKRSDNEWFESSYDEEASPDGSMVPVSSTCLNNVQDNNFASTGHGVTKDDIYWEVFNVVAKNKLYKDKLGFSFSTSVRGANVDVNGYVGIYGKQNGYSGVNKLIALNPCGKFKKGKYSGNDDTDHYGYSHDEL